MAKCACRGDFLDKFIQPAILVLLAEHPCHGFRLLAEMKKRNMVSGSELDPTGFYRTLKKMEEAGHIISQVEDGGTHKPRRVFSLTDEGRGCLSNWYGTLCRYQDNIDVIKSAIEAAIPAQRRTKK